MKTIECLAGGMTALLLLGSGALAEDAAAGGPRAEINATIERLVQIAEAYPGEQNLEKRKEEMRGVIEPKFDFRQMSQLSLGAQWSKITPEQQNEFVGVFSDLLAKTYLNRIGSLSRGMVKITGDKIKNDRALVKTTVKYKGDEFPLDYKLVNRDGGWRVYDVIIENIGLVVNYRSEFAGIIRKEQFSGLMSRLKNKLAEPDEKK